MRALGIIGLLAVLATGYYIYSLQTVRVADRRPPAAQIDVTRVRSDLLSFAQAQRYYLAANGVYGTIGQLQNSPAVSNVPRAARRGYSYSAEIDAARHFVITATPDTETTGLPTLSIDETMTIRP
jgi:hypothetical protein